MQPLARRLSAAGHQCHVPTLRPSDARDGLAPLARALAAFIDATSGPDGRFVLVGFSMGAVLCRWYLQHEAGAARARAFFSIAGPHAGTVTAYLYPGTGVRELRPRSALLDALARGPGAPGVPVVCYWTPYDLMIRPAASARLPGAEHVRIPAWLHNQLVRDRRLAADLIQRLARLDPAPALCR